MPMIRTILLAVVAAPLALASVASVPVTVAAPVAATETLYISAGCPQDTPGTCTSTRWLGTTSGDATSNFLTATTPVDEVLYRADGTINWRDYASDASLRTDGYLLDTSRDLEVDVALTANAVALNDTVHARATLTHCARDAAGAMSDCRSVLLNAPDQTITLVAGSGTAAFTIDLPDTLAGRVLQRMTVEIAVHGINAQGGYIDQQGGSPVRIPHLLEPTA